MRKARFAITLSPGDKAQLEQWESAQGTPPQVALRCRIVLMALAGVQNQELAARLGVSRPTVNLWRKRVQEIGIGEVWEIAPGRGRKPYYDQAKRDAIINSTLQTKGERKNNNRLQKRNHNIMTLLIPASPLC